MEVRELRAEARTGSGKGPARRLRSQGMIPAVFYGGGDASLPIFVNAKDLLKLMKDAEENVFIKLSIQDPQGSTEKLSIIKDIQIDPPSRKLLHADFCAVSMDHEMEFDVPLHFAGTPAGLRDGGEFLHLKREIRVICLPGILPQHIEVDISGLGIGDSLKAGDLSLADGIKLLDHEDAAVATVMAPKVESAAATEGEEESVKEPEVIRQKAREE
jgi:large subunit ribosomal protein L25